MGDQNASGRKPRCVPSDRRPLPVSCVTARACLWQVAKSPFQSIDYEKVGCCPIGPGSIPGSRYVRVCAYAWLREAKGWHSRSCYTRPFFSVSLVCALLTLLGVLAQASTGPTPTATEPFRKVTWSQEAQAGALRSCEYPRVGRYLLILCVSCLVFVEEATVTGVEPAPLDLGPSALSIAPHGLRSVPFEDDGLLTTVLSRHHTRETHHPFGEKAGGKQGTAATSPAGFGNVVQRHSGPPPQYYSGPWVLNYRFETRAEYKTGMGVDKLRGFSVQRDLNPGGIAPRCSKTQATRGHAPSARDRAAARAYSHAA